MILTIHVLKCDVNVDGLMLCLSVMTALCN